MGCTCRGQNIIQEMKSLKQDHIYKHYKNLKDEQSKQKLLAIFNKANIEQSLAFYKKIMNQTQIVLQQNYRDSYLSKKRRFNKEFYYPIDNYAITKKQTIYKQQEQLWNLGITSLSKNQVCVLFMAGKIENIQQLELQNQYGNESICILQIFFQRLQGLNNIQQRVQANPIMVYIMVNQNFEIQFNNYLSQQNYFNYNSSFIQVFSQTVSPVLDYDGKIILISPTQIWQAPTGNGDVYSQLLNRRIFTHMMHKNLKYLYMTGITNILQRVCDPAKLGYMIKQNKHLLSLCCKDYKRDENENLGILGTNKNGKIKIYQGYQVQDASLLYSNCGSCFFNINTLIQKVNDFSSYLAYRKSPIIYENKCYCLESKKFQKANGIVFQSFYHQFFQFIDEIALIQIQSKIEFQPLKVKTKFKHKKVSGSKTNNMDYRKSLKCYESPIFSKISLQ